MKCWPVPKSYSKTLPEDSSSGAFWEDRGDRRHCGVDIYAPEGSPVLAVESGDILDVGLFTSPEIAPYWNKTYYILIRHQNGFIGKYAELGAFLVKKGEFVKAGQVIGHVGSVLNSDKIDNRSPLYIQKLKQQGHPSMLHFELYRGRSDGLTYYFGGNILSRSRPDYLVDPTDYLKNLVRFAHDWNNGIME